MPSGTLVSSVTSFDVSVALSVLAVFFFSSQATSTWSSEGCQISTTANTGNTVVCECDHLSSFTVVVRNTIYSFCGI